MESFDLQLFRVPKFALKVLGFWPETKLTPIHIFHGCVNLLILSWAVITEFGSGMMMMDDPLVALDAIAPSLSKFVTLIKLGMMWVFRYRFRAVIDQTVELLESRDSKEKLKILKRMKTLTSIFGFIVFFFGNLTNATYFFRPIAHNLINYYHGENITREMPFIAWIPFKVDNIFSYGIGYMINSYFGFIAAFGFGGVDGFFVQFCIYVASLFQICREDLKASFYHGPEMSVSSETIQDTRKKLAAVIKKHNLIMDISEEIVDLFTIIIMGHFLSAALVIGVTAIDFLMGSGFNMVVYSSHCIMVIFELFVYCLGGQDVYDSSVDIGRAAYFEEWYKYDVKTQQMLILIMVRSQKGSTVHVPFFAPSISVFAGILGKAMSYVTILRTMLIRSK